MENKKKFKLQLPHVYTLAFILDVYKRQFLFSGIMSRSVLLIIASVLFASSHIVISYKNVK